MSTFENLPAADLTDAHLGRVIVTPTGISAVVRSVEQDDGVTCIGTHPSANHVLVLDADTTLDVYPPSVLDPMEDINGGTIQFGAGECAHDEVYFEEAIQFGVGERPIEIALAWVKAHGGNAVASADKESILVHVGYNIQVADPGNWIIQDTDGGVRVAPEWYTARSEDVCEECGGTPLHKLSCTQNPNPPMEAPVVLARPETLESLISKHRLHYRLMRDGDGFARLDREDATSLAAVIQEWLAT